MTELSPRLQGFPTILRADVPLRLMLSCMNTFARDLSAYLANIISSLIGNLDFFGVELCYISSTINGKRFNKARSLCPLIWNCCLQIF